MNENQPESPNEQLYRPKLVTTTPLIYEWQIRQMAWVEYENRQYRAVNPYESYIYAFTGPRGAGKDESLTLLSIIFLANGIPVHLNYPMKFYYKKDGAEKADLLEAKLLDMEKWLKQDDTYQGSFIGISEFQDWDNAYRQQTTQSLLIHSWVDQIRKMDCSFGYTSKRLNDVGGKTVSETDFEICCTDISSYSEDGYPKQRGAMVMWNPIVDRSGYLTRRMGAYLRPKKQPMYQLWGSFNTYERFNFFDAMRGVKLDLKKRVFGDGSGDGESREIDYEDIRRKTLEIFQSVDRMAPSEYWGTLGVKLTSFQQREILQQLSNDIGFSKGKSGNVYHYKLKDDVVGAGAASP